jgi:hypothetical protein
MFNPPHCLSNSGVLWIDVENVCCAPPISVTPPYYCTINCIINSRKNNPIRIKFNNGEFYENLSSYFNCYRSDNFSDRFTQEHKCIHTSNMYVCNNFSNYTPEKVCINRFCSLFHKHEKKLHKWVKANFDKHSMQY